MSKPVLMVNPEFLPPLPKDLWGTQCSCCNAPESRWELIEPDAAEDADRVFLCSLCFLYESGWGETRRTEIDQMVDAVEKELNVKFVRGEDGTQLTNHRDADRILISIALTSRMFQVRSVQAAHAAAQLRKPQFSLIPDQDTKTPSGLIIPGK